MFSWDLLWSDIWGSCPWSVEDSAKTVEALFVHSVLIQSSALWQIQHAVLLQGFLRPVIDLSDGVDHFPQQEAQILLVLHAHQPVEEAPLRHGDEGQLGRPAHEPGVVLGQRVLVGLAAQVRGAAQPAGHRRLRQLLQEELQPEEGAVQAQERSAPGVRLVLEVHQALAQLHRDHGAHRVVGAAVPGGLGAGLGARLRLRWVDVRMQLCFRALLGQHGQLADDIGLGFYLFGDEPHHRAQSFHEPGGEAQKITNHLRSHMENQPRHFHVRFTSHLHSVIELVLLFKATYIE